MHSFNITLVYHQFTFNLCFIHSEDFYTESGALYNTLALSVSINKQLPHRLSLPYLSDRLYFTINYKYGHLLCPADLRCARVQTGMVEQRTYSSHCILKRPVQPCNITSQNATAAYELKDCLKILIKTKTFAGFLYGIYIADANINLTKANMSYQLGMLLNILIKKIFFIIILLSLVV